MPGRNDGQEGMNAIHDFTKPRVGWWMVALALVVGIMIGRAASGSGVSAEATEPDATATRVAELEELERLRTQVAHPPVCTPAPSPTPTETPAPLPTPTLVPPAQMGEELEYVGDWTVVVTGVTPAPAGASATSGKLIQVNVTVTNRAAEARRFSFDEWRLVDAQGRAYLISLSATDDLYGPSFVSFLQPNLPQELAIVFEVAPDAGPGFILESTADPHFRVALLMQQFG